MKTLKNILSLAARFALAVAVGVAVCMAATSVAGPLAGGACGILVAGWTLTSW